MFLICRRNQPGPLTQAEEAEQIPFNSKLITLSSAEFFLFLFLLFKLNLINFCCCLLLSSLSPLPAQLGSPIV